MQGRIELRPQVPQDVGEIVQVIGASSQVAADRFLEALGNAFDRLAAMPEIASRYEHSPRSARLRAWQIPGFDNYIVFYCPLQDGSGIEVWRVLHGARDVARLLS